MRLGTLRHICADLDDDAEVYINLSPGELHRPDVKVTAVHIGYVHYTELDEAIDPRTLVVLS